MLTLRKIKRAAMPSTSHPNCSTFNFAQAHPKPTPLPHNSEDNKYSENLFAQFKIFIVILQYKYKVKDGQV
jgi:hypothetical protein